MIRYALKCREAHEFEAWFASSGDFDRLSEAGHVSCPICGGGEVEKALMAPAVAGASVEGAPLAAPGTRIERALSELRRKVEAVAENVGRDFPSEARRIHAGEAPERPIRGEAHPAEARALIEDGIPVLPLPSPSRGGH